MNDKTKLTEKTQTRIPLGLLTVICAVIACSLIGIEFFRHFSFNNNAPIENWVTTATYLNNAFSPILLFASVLLLYRTWKDTKEALDFQKAELKIQRENFEKQIKNQEVKDNLEIFSRRVRELSNKFAEKKVIDLMSNTEFSSRMLDLTTAAIDDETISNFRDNEASSPFIKKTIEKYDKEFLSALFTHNYCHISSITLESVFQNFFYEIDDDKDFYDMLISCKDEPDYFVKYIIAYSLIRSEKSVVEISAFYSLLRQIIKSEAEVKKLYIEELLLNFEFQLAHILILIKKDIPNDILDH